MSKKFTFFFTACLCHLLSIAQTEKGTITGNINIGNLRWLSIGNNNTNFSFNPGVGYFIKKNWEVGANFHYSRANDRYHTLPDISANVHGIGINAYTNYYFGKGKLKPYLTLQAGWQHDRGNVTISGIKNNYNENYLVTRIGGGLNWQIRPKIALFTEFLYQKVSPFGRYGPSSLYTTIGARFFFGQKTKRR
jgi:Outer membrane protein beta-barrel domain